MSDSSRDSKQEPGDSSAPGKPARDPGLPSPDPNPTTALVDALLARFVEQLRLALGTELPASGTTALAYVDHYLTLLADETREPIVSLVAAGAGAWFGELIRREIGGQWIGDGEDPRRLRLLLEPALVHFSPIDMAYEAIFVGSPEPGDPRMPEGAALDGAYHLRKRPRGEDSELSEHAWVTERLAEVPPVPEDQFFSLTGRFETLQLILELLASRDAAHGREPTRYHLNDYIEELAG